MLFTKASSFSPFVVFVFSDREATLIKLKYTIHHAGMRRKGEKQVNSSLNNSKGVFYRVKDRHTLNTYYTHTTYAHTSIRV